MALLPFDSYSIGKGQNGGIKCPMCEYVHSRYYMNEMVKTHFCRYTHPDQSPEIDATTQDDARVPHLHRSCIRCNYTWLEKVAGA